MTPAPLTLILRGPYAAQQAFLAALPMPVGMVQHTFADLVTPSPRDRATVYFSLLAHYFTEPKDVVFANTWLDHPGSLDAPRSRMLARLALGMGAVVVNCGSEPIALSGLPTLSSDDYTEAHARFLAFPNLGPGAGMFRPGVSLLVGSSPNSAKHGSLKHRLSFFSMHDGGCSGWLTQHLEDAGVPESGLYWINAYDHHSIPTAVDWLKDLRPARVALLGTDACKWWKYYASPQLVHETLVQGFDHPMFHKRFDAGNPYGLGAFLRGSP